MKQSLASLLLSLLALVPASAQSVAPNDEFATRIVLTGDLPITWSGYAGNLTLEPVDVYIDRGFDPDDSEIEGTMWFEWTAPEAGVYDLRGSEPFSIAAVAAPDPPAPQKPSYDQLAGKDRAVPGLLLRAAAGQRFWMMFVHEGDPVPGDQATLQISLVSPASSAKETATPLPAGPRASVQQVTDGEGWWRWTIPVTGTWRVRANANNAYLSIVRANGTVVGTPSQSFEASAGEEIFIHHDSAGLDRADFVIEPFVTPQNLTPATAMPLGPDVTGEGYFYESLVADQTGTGALLAWFSWVAPRDGLAGFLPYYTSPLYKAYRDDNGTLTQIDSVTNGQRNAYAPVTAGRRYLISFPYGLSAQLRIELRSRGSDSFAGAPELDPNNSPDVYSDATSEPGEPGLHSPDERTRWWTYTPAVDGILYLTGHRVNVYTGSSLNALTLVVSKDKTAGDPTYSPVVNIQAGTVYRVQVFDSPDKSNGLVYFGFHVLPVSPHDRFADAAPVPPSLIGYHNVSLVRVTAEPGEPEATPGVPAARTAWLRWTADFTGRVMIDPVTYYLPHPGGSDAKPALAVWKGNTLTSLERVPVSPFTPPGQSRSLSAFDAVAGNSYSFQVEAPPSAIRYLLQLGRVLTDVRNADAFATPLTAEEVAETGFLAYSMSSRATFEPGESTAGLPAPPSGYSIGSYWVRWTAPATGVWRFANPWRLYEGWYPVFTFYGTSLAGGRLGIISGATPDPVYIKVNQGDTIAIGNLVLQSLADNSFNFQPTMPGITPAVPGIALAQWYGLPSPANLNGTYSSDGIPLLLKHALGLDPLRNSFPGGDDPNASRWPLPALTPAGDLSLTFRTAAPFTAGADVNLSGEISRDLLTWLPAPETPAPNGERTVYVPANGPERFLRLKATLR
ncbi:MAG TPA: hypothetical protein VG796_08900 [Verrucomicrobiales bacterium]|nr:hypothetical protein [Verrucomicrobiales bacterium]